MLPNVFLIVVSFGSKPFYLTAYLFIRERHDDKRSRTNNAPSILLYDHLLVPVLAATFTVSVLMLAATFTVSVLMLAATFTVSMPVLAATFTVSMPVLAATFTVSMPVLATTFTISVVMMSTSTAAAMTFFVLPGYL
jgi:hypothetical protein